MAPKLDAAETMSTMDDDDDAVIKGSQEVVSLAYCCRVPSQSSCLFGIQPRVNTTLKDNKLEMWADAQRNGRPAEYGCDALCESSVIPFLVPRRKV